MEPPSESTRIWNQLGFLSRRASPWGYTQAFGTLMIGPQGVVSSKLIGPKLLSLLPTGTSTPMLVFGMQENPHAVQILLPLLHLALMHGYHKSWIQLLRRGWTGCRRITWFTITAPIRRDFLKAFLLNAHTPRTALGSPNTHNNCYKNHLFIYFFNKSLCSFTM